MSQPAPRQFPCQSCGASLIFAPGTTSLVCPYCGSANEIAPSAETVGEEDYRAELARLERGEAQEEVLTVKCNVCGAESTLPANVTADRCPFCGSAIVAAAMSKKQIRPRSLLPFAVAREPAMERFRRWIAGLWFAPGGLARAAEASGLKGVYIPAWTYDCDTRSRYTGQRGDDYWVTESYTAVVNGKPVRQTRQVRKTRWRPVSGLVENQFDDVLVLASHSLPRQYAEALEPWDLKKTVPYGDDYLSGFVAESYQVGLEPGFELAKQLMEPTIHATIRRDIGGDHQRIEQVRTRYDHITFKHLLLPVWISAYRYREKTYRFLVNARTGEVQGERPWSAIKITLAILAAIVAMLLLLWFTQGLRT